MGRLIFKGWREHGVAQGDVVIPPGRDVKLSAGDTDADGFPHLTDLAPDASVTLYRDCEIDGCRSGAPAELDRPEGDRPGMGETVAGGKHSQSTNEGSNNPSVVACCRGIHDSGPVRRSPASMSYQSPQRFTLTLGMAARSLSIASLLNSVL